MANSKLYPPIIEGTIPAFYKTGNSAIVKVPFSMNRATSINEVKTIHLIIKTVLNAEIKAEADAENVDFASGMATFSINANNLNIGLSYKLQLAFKDTNTQIGFYSTVGIIKCIAKPSVSISGYSAGSLNAFSNSIIGVYQQDTNENDSTEKVYSYRFDIWDKDNKLIKTSGDLIHNTSEDTDPYSSLDIFTTNRFLFDNEIAYVLYSVKTLNGCSLSTAKYRVTKMPEINMVYPLIIEPVLNFDEGYINLQLKYNSNLEEVCSGKYLIMRGSLQDNYREWVEIARFSLCYDFPSNFSFKDYTIELGITYKYSLLQYNDYDVYSKPVITEPIYADFEDMFLFDGIRQLKIKYNPKVNSFKADIPELKTDTIGSKYPYFFRNGKVNYKEFPISGLISYWMDEALLFLLDNEPVEGDILREDVHCGASVAPQWESNIAHTEEEKGADWKYKSLHEDMLNLAGRQLIEDGNTYQRQSTERIVSNGTDPYKEGTYSIKRVTDLVSDNIMSERYFKLKVLEWLTNGKPKLFRSPGEGNYIVRLMNTSMTPIDSLGRMLHNFSSTAYECADCSYENLIKLGFVTIENKPNEIFLTATYNFTDKESNEETIEGINNLIGFRCEDFEPGDMITVTAGGSELTFIIGATGALIYEYDDRVISKIVINKVSKPTEQGNIYSKRLPFYATDFHRTLHYNFIGPVKTRFDEIKGVHSYTIANMLVFGDNKDILATLKEKAVNHYNDELFGYKIKLLNLEQLVLTRKQIVPVFDNNYTTVFGKDITDNNKLTEISPRRFNPNNLNEDKSIEKYYKNYQHGNEDINNKIDASDLPEYLIANSGDFTYTIQELQGYVEEFDTEYYYNLGPIDNLTIGDGLIAYLVPQVVVVDYSFEDDTNTDYNGAIDLLTNGVSEEWYNLYKEKIEGRYSI